MEWTLSVTQLNEYVRKQLASDPVLRSLRVSGEISGIKKYASGHYYFSLKDEGARVQCVMFRQNAAALNFTPADGMRVIAKGSASVYVRDGSYQLYVEELQAEGIGDLYRRFCLLRDKLASEGLFDPSIKRPLPFMPKKIGIVTSFEGSVLHDIVTVGWNRYPNMRFILAPCAVQGEGAADEICASIEALNRLTDCDVILCGRGGGSLEDLWAFNEEKVARAIRASRIPVISCVGHETDFTIADFASDCRCATPSAASETAVPLKKALLEELGHYAKRIRTSASRKINTEEKMLELYQNSHVLKNLSQAYVQPRVTELGEFARRTKTAAFNMIRNASVELQAYSARLGALKPEAPLEKGYALIERDGEIIDRINGLKSGDLFQLIMHDGKRKAVAGERYEDG